MTDHQRLLLQAFIAGTTVVLFIAVMWVDFHRESR